MSFYGSVYYQLIDTFYKIIVKNSGDKNYTFNENLINPSETPVGDIIESPAVGRKGVFSLDSGNYWINFSKNDEADESAPYKIWHSQPHNDEETRLPISGWRIETDKYVSVEDEKGNEIEVTKDGVKMEAGKDYIQLVDHDFLRMVETNYDEAGHIIGDSTQEVVYRLPKTNISSRLDYLEQLVGEPSEYYPLPRWDEEGEMPEGTTQDGTNSIMTITDYAEKNYADIKLLEKYVGDWTKITEFWGESFHVAPTIADVLGDVESMYAASDSADDYTEFFDWFSPIKDENGDRIGYKLNLPLSALIGALPPMWAAINVDGSNTNPVSISNAIINLKTRIESVNSTLTAANSTTQLALQGVADRVYTIETEDIPEILEAIDALEQEDINIRRDFIDADAVLQKNLDDEITARLQADDVLQDNIDKEANVRLEKDTILQSNIDKESDERKQRDSELQTSMDTHVTSVNGLIDGIGRRIDSVESTHSTHNELIWATIGTGENSGTSTIYGRLNNIDNILNNNSLTLEDHESRIENLEAKLGEDTFEDKTITGQITENKINIAALTTDLSNYKEEVATSFDGVQQQFDSINTNTAEISKTVNGNVSAISSINQSISEINTTLTTLEKIDHSQYATNTQLNELSNTVTLLSEVVGDGSSLEEGQSILSLLSELTNEIRGIKVKINELHIDGDVPFPDVVDDTGSNT